ncbi:MAG: ABC transporter ATP-binding protein [Deltaproteobacteria bacterium]|nr:ABC transporter ATP-binding protein [Deltaproteobacteria bacterium]
MPDVLIDVRQVSKSFRGAKAPVAVLHEVSLQVSKGEYLAIVGTSGSGKSTLLNVMGGLDADYQGHVLVDGLDLSRLSDRQLSAFRNQTIGFIFQQFNLLEHLSCAENVAMPALFSRTEVADPLGRAREALDRVGLGARAGDLAANLSGGQKQRVAIARALFQRPPILLCDEPTGNLDSETGKQIIELFQRLNGEDGITLVIVTHEARVSRTAHRVVRLEDGRLATEVGAVGVEANHGDGP